MNETPPRSLRIERLREPSADERTAIFALEAAAFSNPWTPDTFDTLLQSPASQVWVVRDGSQIVAFCACYVFADYLDINTVAVDASRRRQGIARSLLQRILSDTGVPCATLEVRASNTSAIRLYQGLGFTVTSARSRYYENPEEDGLILWLNP